MVTGDCVVIVIPIKLYSEIVKAKSFRLLSISLRLLDFADHSIIHDSSYGFVNQKHTCISSSSHVCFYDLGNRRHIYYLIECLSLCHHLLHAL